MAKAKQEGEQTEHTVLQNLRHNGKHYNPKSTVKLTADEAKPLVAAKIVEPKAPETK